MSSRRPADVDEQIASRIVRTPSRALGRRDASLIACRCDHGV